MFCYKIIYTSLYKRGADLKKVFWLIILCVAFSIGNISICLPCKAVSTPHIVIDGEVWLLDNDNGSRLFLLPNTYYAKIDNIDDNYYYISFNGICGKVDKTSVSTVGYHKQACGTLQELSIDPQFSDFKTICLKSSMDSSSQEILLPVEDSFIFLGEYPQSEMWYCIKYNEKIGYIKASRTTVPSMEIQPFIPEIETEENTNQNDTDTTIDNGNPAEDPFDFLNKNDTLRVLIIIGISIPALFLIFLLFRPTKKSKHRYYYEE